MTVEMDPNRDAQILLGFTPAEKLEYFLTEYSDEIPDKVLHSTSTNKNYKCRKGWFQSVGTVLEVLINSSKIRGDTRKVADNFIQNTFSDEFRSKETISKEDITTANEVIKTVLGALR